MTLSETINLANALMSPFFWSISTRNSRAAPTAFLAADNNASCTAPTRTSRLMPFSRSQNSRTAKKSAFIRSMLRLYPANKKVGRYASSDFRALDEPANFTVLGGRLRSWLEPVKPKQTVLIQGKIGVGPQKSQSKPQL